MNIKLLILAAAIFAASCTNPASPEKIREVEPINKSTFEKFQESHKVIEGTFPDVMYDTIHFEPETYSAFMYYQTESTFPGYWLGYSDKIRVNYKTGVAIPKLIVPGQEYKLILFK